MEEDLQLVVNSVEVIWWDLVMELMVLKLKVVWGHKTNFTDQKE